MRANINARISADLTKLPQAICLRAAEIQPIHRTSDQVPAYNERRLAQSGTRFFAQQTAESLETQQNTRPTGRIQHQMAFIAQIRLSGNKTCRSPSRLQLKGSCPPDLAGIPRTASKFGLGRPNRKFGNPVVDDCPESFELCRTRRVCLRSAPVSTTRHWRYRSESPESRLPGLMQ